MNQSPDLICQQETFLYTNDVVGIPGYTVIRKDRTNERAYAGGGVCICIRNGTDFQEIKGPYWDNGLEAIAVSISDIIIVNVNNPPSNTINCAFLTNVAQGHILSFAETLTPTMVYGDSDVPNTNENMIVEQIENYDLTLVNTFVSTHMTMSGSNVKWSLIYLTITSPTNAHKCLTESTYEFLNSDHCLVLTKINEKASSGNNNNLKLAFSKANWNEYQKLCIPTLSMGLGYKQWQILKCYPFNFV